MSNLTIEEFRTMLRLHDDEVLIFGRGDKAELLTIENHPIQPPVATLKDVSSGKTYSMSVGFLLKLLDRGGLGTAKNQ